MRKRLRQWRSGMAAAVFFSSFCGQVGCAPAADSSQMKTIFVFGDSLSEGLAISPRQAWPMLLVEKLRPIGPNFRVINASASGSTTEGGLHRLPPHLEHPVDIFVLELGINDAFHGIPSENASPAWTEGSHISAQNHTNLGDALTTERSLAQNKL